jgi:phosphoglycolate phosphatase-like HAD superfamily hydrolase
LQPSYERIATQQGPAFLRKGAQDSIEAIDSIVFDCDGVLIDVRESYDCAIVTSVDWLIRRLFNLAIAWKGPSLRLIQEIRNTGLFNNDWDTVYAICLLTAGSLPDDLIVNFSTDGTKPGSRCEKLSGAEVARVFSKVRRMVDSLRNQSSESKSESAAEVVWDSLPENRIGLCKRVKEYLGYPGNPPSSLLATVFDEFYHGGTLYRDMYGAAPRYHKGPGFIERDQVVVRRSDLASLSEAVQGRLAMVTGRPRRAADYSMGELISYFDQGASVFIGDGDIRPTREAASFRKPSGKSLLFAREKLRSRKLVYVGDSAEDLQMVENARASSDGLAFVGIYASSYKPGEQLRFFRERRAELILPSVRALAGVMKEVNRR